MDIMGEISIMYEENISIDFKEGHESQQNSCNRGGFRVLAMSLSASGRLNRMSSTSNSGSYRMSVSTPGSATWLDMR